MFWIKFSYDFTFSIFLLDTFLEMHPVIEREICGLEGMNSSNIWDFYREANILITGGTGFVGKVLIEKLLRSCNSIKSINLLMRTKKGIQADDRLKDLLKQSVC